ncbi:tetratricopeptide repeat protein [Shewanella aestuarii]|uniref:Sel1 repeat family protein n=1 Tax=Shewanella aestuarii TaxID=1028752 RepID=A0A6G9QRE9_9GAMM|nr:tetratricopeptide repeat protein [Shewanella aestuarii]QIR16607.1 sel1 repeat family protein [Shewanella aestuarii]
MKKTTLATVCAILLLGAGCAASPLQAEAEANIPNAQYKYGLQLIAAENFAQGKAYILKSMQAGDQEAIQFWDTYEQWVNTLIKAKQGDIASQREVGYNYSLDNSPVSTVHDPELTLKWLSNASEQGDHHSSFLLGQLYSEGRVFNQDEKTAFDWFYKAARQGSPDGKFELYRRYLVGNGVNKDAESAEFWLKSAVIDGQADASVALIDHYYLGSANQNLAHATHWLAVQGDKQRIAPILPYLSKLKTVKSMPAVYSSFDSDTVIGQLKAGSDLYALYFEGDWVEVFSPRQNLLGVMHVNDVSVQQKPRSWALKNNYQLCKVECNSRMCYQTNADGTYTEYSFDPDKAAMCLSY